MNNDKLDEEKEKKNILQMDVKDLFKSDILKQDISPKMALIVIGILLTIGLYGYFIIYPKYTEYKSTVSNLEAAQGELLQYKQRMDEIPLLEEKLSDLTREAKVKSKKLSHDMEDGLFLIGLDKMIMFIFISPINCFTNLFFSFSHFSTHVIIHYLSNIFLFF